MRDWSVAIGILFVLISLGISGKCLAQQRSLADLVLEAETQDVSPPQQPATHSGDAARDMRRLIDERDRIGDQADLFPTLRELLREEPRYMEKMQRVTGALRGYQAAQNRLQIAQGLARGTGPEAVAAAQDNFNAAAQALANTKSDAAAFYESELRRRYERVSGALPSFFENYGRMRKLLTHSRVDPNRDALVHELEQGVHRCDEFVEGHVLNGINYVYAGDSVRAEAAFTKASAINGTHGMVFTVLGIDCCYGLLLLDRADTVDDYIKQLKRLDRQHQTPARCWLIAAHAYAKGKHNDAVSFFAKAVARSKGNASPELRAEASMPYLFAENKIDLKKAVELLDGLEDQGAWQVLRANAGCAAEREEWAQATALIGACSIAAPPRLEKELSAQRAAYEASTPWRLPPKKTAVKN